MKKTIFLFLITLLLLQFALIRNATAKSFKKPEVNEAALQKIAASEAEAWLKIVDNNWYEKAYNLTSSYMKRKVPKKDFIEALENTRKPFGKALSRKLRSARYMEQMAGGPTGKYVVLQYQTVFENGRSARETITPMFDLDDGKWRVAGYFIK